MIRHTSAIRIRTPGRSEMEQLEMHVQSRLNGRVRSFHLVVRECGLVLTGRAGTYHAKQLAQHAVMEATSLPILANEIEVYLDGAQRLQPLTGGSDGGEHVDQLLRTAAQLGGRLVFQRFAHGGDDAPGRWRHRSGSNAG